MPRFFVLKQQISDGCVTLTGDDAHHIARSLRMAQGEKITVCDENATVYDCVLTSFDADQTVVARILESHRSESEPPFIATICQALPKGDKLDLIIQKSVECGADRIVPFESENCIARVRDDSEERKTRRRQRIAEEAAKQSGRGKIPKVTETVSFKEMLALGKDANFPIFCYEGVGTATLKEVIRGIRASKNPSDRPTVFIVIGSEGGFSAEEAELARKTGFFLAGLGPRILRAETVSGFVLGCIAYEFEM